MHPLFMLLQGAASTDVDFNWLQTQDTFNTLLKDLNKACGSENGAIPTGWSHSCVFFRV
jgi:hypothetical protein